MGQLDENRIVDGNFAARQSEIEQLDGMVRLRQEEIGWLDVTMDEPDFVSVLQCIRRLGHEITRVVYGKRPMLPDVAAEIAALHVFHGVED